MGVSPVTGPDVSRRQLLTAGGATGLAAFGGVGILTRGSRAYTDTSVVQEGRVELEADWRETYNGDVLEDTRASEFETGGALISLGDVMPGDVGTVSVRLRNVSEVTAEPRFSLELTGTAENGVIEPERKAGDDGGNGELQEFLQTKLWYDGGLGGIGVLGGDNAVQDAGEGLLTEDAEGSLAAVAPAIESVSLATLGPGDSVTVSFRWSFDADAAARPVEVAAGDSVTFAFDISAGGEP